VGGNKNSDRTWKGQISGCHLVTYKKCGHFYTDISTTSAINMDLTDIPAGTDYDLFTGWSSDVRWKYGAALGKAALATTFGIHRERARP
jgi:hypothetical protein